MIHLILFLFGMARSYAKRALPPPLLSILAAGIQRQVNPESIAAAIAEYESQHDVKLLGNVSFDRSDLVYEFGWALAHHFDPTKRFARHNVAFELLDKMHSGAEISMLGNEYVVAYKWAEHFYAARSVRLGGREI